MSYYTTTFAQRSIIHSKIREQNFSKQINSRKLIVPLLICAIISFSILYIIQINSITAGGYTIRKYKSEISRLQSEYKNLELNLSGVQSLNFLEQRAKNLNMIKTEKVEYVSLISEVAAR